MRSTRGRIVVIETETEFTERLADGARRLTGWRVVGLDLRDHAPALAACDASRATFVGCAFAAGDAERLAASGALLLPAVGASPIDPRRTTLYDAAALYDATPWEGSLDGRTYAWSQETDAPEDLLTQTLHDEAIDSALRTWIAGRRLVGVMGGHALRRGEPAYGDAARLGALLGRDLVVATGGGPGAMEAANLGARLAHEPPARLDDALARLAAVPSYHPSVDAWLEVAATLAAEVAAPTPTLGIPTWHYGHEPPNVFATAIAKYFRNAIREAVLLQICTAGIVFLPGAAGTVQEIFADACENYYAAGDEVAPMVLVGRRHWTETLPAWPLLQALARERAMEEHVHLVDTVEEAAALLR